MSFHGTRALVTGASRGLGAALVDALQAEGAEVLGLARTMPERPGIHTLSADIGDKDTIHHIAGVANAVLGGVDLLVHNASTLGPLPLRPLLDTECEDLEAVLQTNLVGPFRLSRALIGAMVVRGHGTVVHLSSDAAVEGYPDWGAYGVSKAALDQLGRVWAAELAPAGVRVLSIDPGEMDTRMHADALPGADPATLRRPEAVAARILSLLADPTVTGRVSA